MIGIWILIALLAFCILAIFILGSSNADLSERIRKANARAEFLLDELDRFADVCQQLTGELRKADELALKQARKSLEQQDRIAQIEARELPQLTELRGDPFDWAAEHPPIFADVSNVVPLRGAK